jgi:cell division protein FtsB
MKKTICFILLAFSCFGTSANILQNNNVGDTVQIEQKVEQNTEKIVNADNTDVVNGLTLAVNAINNIQTWSAVMIAILTLIVAIFGFIGYFRISHVLKSNVAQVQKKIEEINAKEQEFNNCISQTKAQEKYIYKTNECFLDALDKIANQITDTTNASFILRDMLHNYHITNLYSAEDKFAALADLEVNGTREDIEHLEYVSNNDSDEYNKSWAREIIGIIRHRNA